MNSGWWKLFTQVELRRLGQAVSQVQPLFRKCLLVERFLTKLHTCIRRVARFTQKDVVVLLRKDTNYVVASKHYCVKPKAGRLQVAPVNACFNINHYVTDGSLPSQLFTTDSVGLRFIHTNRSLTGRTMILPSCCIREEKYVGIQHPIDREASKNFRESRKLLTGRKYWDV